MVDTDYKTLKTRIEELIENIDKIDREATSFSAAKGELVKVSEDLHTICSEISVTIKTAAAVLNQVESVAVSNTLESMKNSADSFDEVAHRLATEFEMSINESIEKYANINRDFSDKIMTAYEEYVQTLQQKINAFEQVMNESAEKYVGVSTNLSNKLTTSNEEQMKALQREINNFEQTMSESADKYVKASMDLSNKIITTNEDHVHTIQLRVDGFEQSIKEMADKCEGICTDLSNKVITTNDALAAEIKKKMYIMGGIALLTSTAALIFAIV